MTQTSAIDVREVPTARLRTSVRMRGEGEPVVFVHGNLSDAQVWDGQLERLPRGYRGVAVDLRGFGRSERAPVDATRGVRDFADDVAALLDALELGRAHLVGHSMGAGVVLQLAIQRPESVRSIVLAAPMSPYGFGGTRPDGTPCAPDHAGSGGGAANPELVRLLEAGDRTTEHQASPRNVIRGVFFPSPDAVRDEEVILDGMLRGAIGDDYYPGDFVASDHWPNLAPGTRGVLNAISPKYCNLSGFARSGLAVPVLWVHGDADAVISDRSMVDLGNLGSMGVVPGWPGPGDFPAQPMVAQTRALLEEYRRAGGTVREEAWEGVGHFPFNQEPDRFAKVLREHLVGQ